MRKKLKQIKEKLPELITSGCIYIGAGIAAAGAQNQATKTACLMCFLIAFAVFGGLIIRLMDLKYIGHRFLTKK